MDPHKIPAEVLFEELSRRLKCGSFDPVNDPVHFGPWSQPDPSTYQGVACGQHWSITIHPIAGSGPTAGAKGA